jgi:penicillin-binding protein 2
MKRVMFLWISLTVLFAVLFLRLIQLSFFEGEKNRVLADTQRIKIRKVIAPRGIIYDRKMKPLVFNSPIFRNCSKKDQPCEYINRETALSLEAQNKDADLVIDIGRKYPLGKATSFVLGYLGEASPEEVSAQKYQAGDFVGRSGLEEQYDNLLRGVDGGELVETNTEGLTVRKIGQKEPVTGLDLILNLDADLQKAAFEALNGNKGAIVVQNPNTGEVLALVSSPSFDPSDITQKDLSNPDNPLFNRAISGGYPPGSTFKIVSSVAALEEKIITAETIIEDTGIIRIGQYSYSNWYFTSRGKTEGKINIVRAIARSTDTFFYKLGEMVGPNKIIEWAKKFGLGSKTGIDIPGEITGLSRFWGMVFG